MNVEKANEEFEKFYLNLVKITPPVLVSTIQELKPILEGAFKSGAIAAMEWINGELKARLPK
jgi:hypothetical protein